MSETHFYKFSDVVGEIMGAPKPLLISSENISHKFSTPTWHEGLDHGELESPGIFVTMLIKEAPSHIIVNAEINARKKGDEALRLLLESLKSIAKISGKVVIHKGEPTNEAAEALFKRHPEYKKVGEQWVLEVSPD